jgi:hypothetical protein
MSADLDLFLIKNRLPGAGYIINDTPFMGKSSKIMLSKSLPSELSLD